jgi:hypothetical protein
VWLANLTGQNQTVGLAGHQAASTTLVLDEDNFAQPRAASVENVSSIPLRPYAVACLKLRSGS